MAVGAGELLQGGADRLGDQLQAGQVPHRRQDVGGVGALAGPLWWKPGSSRSRPSAYLKSIRHRTASAASRSDRSSRNCIT
jgi:hypothetical protein